MSVYHHTLLDHYRTPRHKRPLNQSADFSSGVLNPSCGDMIAMHGLVRDGACVELVFDGYGCVVSQATADVLIDAVLGKQLDEMARLDAQQIIELINMPLGPTRLKCALLALQALHKGIATYQQKGRDTHA
jgi:nitrogen fixation NifU-like protein